MPRLVLAFMLLISAPSYAGLGRSCALVLFQVDVTNQPEVQALDSEPGAVKLPKTGGGLTAPLIPIPHDQYERMGQRVDWKARSGTLVGADFRKDPAKEKANAWTVSQQLVLAGEDIPFEVRLGIERLLPRTRAPTLFGGEFRESGIGVVVTKKNVYFSRVVTSGYRDRLSSVAIDTARSDVLALIRREEGSEFTIVRSSFIHTHPGSGTPLNMGDQRSFDEGSTAVFLDVLGQRDTIRSLYAIPEADQGDVAFAYVR